MRLRRVARLSRLGATAIVGLALLAAAAAARPARAPLTSIVSVKALPNPKSFTSAHDDLRIAVVLEPATITPVTMTKLLAFEVQIRNESDRVRRVHVTLAIKRPGANTGAIVMGARSDPIAQHRTKTVTFSNVQSAAAAQRTSLASLVGHRTELYVGIDYGRYSSGPHETYPVVFASP